MNKLKGLEGKYALIGLGKMGLGLLQLLTASGQFLNVYDTNKNIKLNDFLSRKCLASDSIDEFLASLTHQCTIFVCIPAGPDLDYIFEKISTLGLSDLTLVDFGNSFYADSIRRYSVLKASGIRFVDVGVSGGVHIASAGACLMIGGETEDMESLGKILHPLVPRERGSVNEFFVGGVGSGHFVKMVHNAVEYAFLQLWSECVYFLMNLRSLSGTQIIEVIRHSNVNMIQGYISDITCEILGERDPDGNPLLHQIENYCGANGTGALAVVTALNHGVACNVLATAVDCRLIKDFGQPMRYDGEADDDTIEVDPEIDGQIFRALSLAYACAIAQGIELINTVSARNNWRLDIRKILNIWKSGSIIRGGWIDELRVESNATNFEVEQVLSDYLDCLPSLRRTVSEATHVGYPMPCHVAALSLLDSMLSKRVWTALVAAQRDFFGGHGFRMAGSAELQRWQWSKC